MPLRSLSLRGFRNLADVPLAVNEGLTVVVGANGAGKTNLLEAITVLANVSSFRPGGPRSWVRHGERSFQLLGSIDSGRRSHELCQTLAVSTKLSRTLTCDRKIVDTASYLELFPVVALSSEDRQLLLGPPAGRRRFLDRLAFLLFPEALPVLQSYRRALRQRNALLAGAGSERELDAFERDLASSGGRLMVLRQRTVAALQGAFSEELEALSGSHFGVKLRYHTGEREGVGEAAVAASKLRAALVRSRGGDRLRGYTLVGPHRHDLQMAAQGRLAREILSAGQAKLVVTALQLAAAGLYQRIRGRHPTVLFDDVDAEFDVSALGSVLSRLVEGGQVIVSSAHEEYVLPRLPAATLWRMRSGEVVAAGGEGSPG